jgi:hypothetical protein
VPCWPPWTRPARHCWPPWPTADAEPSYTIAGNGAPALTGDGGPATAAGLANPAGITADGTGNLFIADANNNRVREVEP